MRQISQALRTANKHVILLILDTAVGFNSNACSYESAVEHQYNGVICTKKNLQYIVNVTALKFMLFN